MPTLKYMCICMWLNTNLCKHKHKPTYVYMYVCICKSCLFFVFVFTMSHLFKKIICKSSAVFGLNIYLFLSFCRSWQIRNPVSNICILQRLKRQWKSKQKVNFSIHNEFPRHASKYRKKMCQIYHWTHIKRWGLICFVASILKIKTPLTNYKTQLPFVICIYNCLHRSIYIIW